MLLSTIDPLIREIQEWLFRLYARKKFACFCWVLSHAGITSNKRID